MILLGGRGRGGKVFWGYGGDGGYRIEKKIYGEKVFWNERDNFVGNENVDGNRLLIVDEGCMIGNEGV